ncbi:hypothetical protein CWI37_1636p0010 [Hamiltosporidium tvaerminnensis]|uniref:Uncharacterized protein n=2 Tax=Hamiltosporidium tvaerminnensis TaxID=1176355 RepID=A0A4Q9KVU4_9MICR|nr:hypothetical protein CWI37_1636p0010 [Hamiltosporidium tvaerminnensis]
MNSYQDVIDSVSFRVPYLKKFIHFYLRKIERLIPEYLKKSLDKQIETLKKRRINSNFTKFTTYEVIFLQLIQNFISDLLSNSMEDDASERGFDQYNERIRNVLKSEVDDMNLEIISDLEKVQNNRNTEGYKNTKKDAIKFVSDLQDNHIFKKIFIQRIFKILEEGFKSFWIENFESLKFESENKSDVYNMGLQNNTFFNTILKDFKENSWPLPYYYTRKSSHEDKPCLLLFFGALFTYMLESHFNKMFPKIFKNERIFLHFIHNERQLIVPLDIKIRENSFISPIYTKEDLEFICNTFFHHSLRTLYLSFYFRIENWLFIFGEQLLLTLGKEDFFAAMRNNISDRKVIRKRQTTAFFKNVFAKKRIFCEEIGTFFSTLKSRIIESPTYAYFYIYKVQDIDMSNIPKEIFKKYRIENFVSNCAGKHPFASSEKNLFIYFMDFLETTIEEQFTGEPIKEKKVVWNH